jgi:uncharacterized coiled-coil protein SlyX
MWYNNVKGNACGALSFFIGKTKMQESLETKIARIEERLALEVKGLNNSIAEFRTDMKSALSTLGDVIDKLGERMELAGDNKSRIDSMEKDFKRMEGIIVDHKKEDNDFHKQAQFYITVLKVLAVVGGSLWGVIRFIVPLFIK